MLVKEWHVAPFFLHSAKILVVSAEFVKSAGAIFHPVWEQQEGSGCFLVIQGRWGCMLIYFEHVLIVIYRLADGESSELCGERVASRFMRSKEAGLGAYLFNNS